MKLRPLLILGSIFASLWPASLNASFIWAWGSDTNGATVLPADLTNAVAIAAGYAHALAARHDGTVVAWGNNDFGQCNVPTGLSNVVQVAASHNYSLALKADGTVVAWGTNDVGQLNVPPTLGQVISVAAGYSGALALRANGQVVAWGGVPSVPADLTNAIALAASSFGVALRADRTLTAWGGPSFNFIIPPGLNNVTSVVGGASYCIALGLDGTVTGWGYYNYTLGCPFQPGPCPFAPVANVIPSKLPGGVALFGGDNTTLALRNDGTIVAWGEETNLPPNLSAVTALSAGGHVFLALSDIPQIPQPKIEILFIGPLSQTVAPGSEAFFSLRADGSSPLRYQWYFGTNALAGQTNRWLALYNVQGTQQGTYTVVVTGPDGSVTSQPVTLSVQTALQVNMVPAISLSGLAPGASYSIEYINAVGPTNAWTQLTTVSLTNNAAFYFDTSAIGQPGRLYRLVQLP